MSKCVMAMTVAEKWLKHSPRYITEVSYFRLVCDELGPLNRDESSSF